MASKKLQIVGLDIPQSDWNQVDDTKLDYIKNKPTLGAGLSLNEDNEIVIDDEAVFVFDCGTSTETI